MNPGCDQLSGQCDCRTDSVAGRKCDRCVENTAPIGGGGECQPCPPCYSLVQAAVDRHREGLAQLDSLLQVC